MNLSQQIARLKMTRDLRAGYCDDEEVARAIRSVPTHYAALTGEAHGLTVPNFTDGEKNRQLNNRGDSLEAQSLPPLSELVRNGNSYSAAIPTGSHFNSVAAFPSTRAELNLWNGEPDTGKTYVIDMIWFVSKSDIGAAACMTLVAQILPGRQTAVTDNTAVLRWSMNGKTTATMQTKALISLGGTLMVASRWMVCAATAACPAVTIGHGVSSDVFGRLMVPPGSILGINVVVGTAVATTMVGGVTWHEVQLALGN